MEILEITDLKEMLKKTEKLYENRPAYKIRVQEGYKIITHKELRNMVNALGTQLIELGLKGKRIAVIGENRYEWQIAYLSVVCGTGIVVPLDKSLPENEIKRLIQRADVEAIFYSEKYEEQLQHIFQSKETKLKYLFSMVKINEQIKKGQGEAIAKSMFEMAKLKVPVITIVIGEGSSGGALAISTANKIIMLENAIYSILSPEGYASILWKDSNRAKEAAEKMKLTAQDLYDFKIIDKIIDEKKEFETTALNMREEILTEIKSLSELSKAELVEQRYSKFRQIGTYKERI